MNIDIEKLRNELKNKVDEIIDLYINDDNEIIQIPQDKIYMEFDINNQSYIAFTEDSEEVEEMEMLFAKVDLLEGNRILRNIETEEEYTAVINEFNKRQQIVSGEEI